MEEQNKPIWQMTSGEFQKMLDHAIESAVEKKFREMNKFLDKKESIIDYQGIQEKYGIPVSSMRTHKSRENIPCLRRGGKVFFRESDILEWLDSERKR